MKTWWEGVWSTDTLAQMFSSLRRCVSRPYPHDSSKLHVELLMEQASITKLGQGEKRVLIIFCLEGAAYFSCDP